MTPASETAPPRRDGLSPRTQELWLAAMRARRRADELAQATAQ
jgi:hypothetical protein